MCRTTDKTAAGAAARAADQAAAKVTVRAAAKAARSLFLLCTLLVMLAFSVVCAADDGVFAPGTFSFYGGSGKAKITCDAVTIAGEEVTARIVFHSPWYSYVKVDGVQYDPAEQDAEQTVFEIPAVLDREFPILALTTRMSTPHEIEYRLFLSLEGESTSAESADGETAAADAQSAEFPEPLTLPGLTGAEEMAFTHLQRGRVIRYAEGPVLIDIPPDGRYLLLPEEFPVPEGLPEEVKIIRQPLTHIYLAATSAMSFFDAIGALDAVTLTGTAENGWAIEAPVRALQEGRMRFAGKYSEPDYELLVSEGCELAVESTMILHTPQVQEMLEDLGIPVFIDRSSYESDPLGRAEWIRIYGVLTGREAEADALFAGQCALAQEWQDLPPAGLVAAFFSVRPDGTVVVRKSSDLVANMIRLAGGTYFLTKEDDTPDRSASMVISMEEFYHEARDADVLVYNGTIEGTISRVDELLAKSELFADFKAVQEDMVWAVDQAWYQSAAEVGSLIRDFHGMLTGSDPAQMRFLKKVTK